MIRLAHADAAEAAEIINGILNPLDDETITAIELLAISVHLKAEDSGLNRNGDFRCAGGFCAVTDDSR